MTHYNVVQKWHFDWSQTLGNLNEYISVCEEYIALKLSDLLVPFWHGRPKH